MDERLAWFVIATLALCVLGALNAVLVMRVCRQFGLTSRASGLAGLFYASWYGSVSGEFEVKLSPLENMFLLLGLLLLLRSQRKTAGRVWLADLAAGAVLGLTMTTKIWWVVPVLLLLLWHAWTQRSARSGLLVALGAAALYLPNLRSVLCHRPITNVRVGHHRTARSREN